MTATSTNFPTLLTSQLSSEITDTKKHKPLLLGFSARERPGTLEFNRELTKLANTVHRQFQVALTDCHFEGELCSLFEPDHLPALFLFKDGKVFTKQKTEEVTTEGLLDYLSGDNYVKQSEVKFDNSDQFIRDALGLGGNFLSRTYNRYGKQLESYYTDLSKRMFKGLGFGHWHTSVQMGLSLLVTFLPICFLFTVAIAKTIVGTYNFVCRKIYERKLGKLNARRQECVNELNRLKKTN